jgi:hypothetical protein
VTKYVGTGKGGVVDGGGTGDVVAKLFVMAKGPQKFLEAHGLEQWRADDVEPQVIYCTHCTRRCCALLVQHVATTRYKIGLSLVFQPDFIKLLEQ